MDFELARDTVRFAEQLIIKTRTPRTSNNSIAVYLDTLLVGPWLMNDAQMMNRVKKQVDGLIKRRQDRPLKSPDSKNRLTTRAGRLIERLSYFWLSAVAIVVVLLSAAYFNLSQNYHSSLIGADLCP